MKLTMNNSQFTIKFQSSGSELFKKPELRFWYLSRKAGSRFPLKYITSAGFGICFLLFVISVSLLDKSYAQDEPALKDIFNNHFLVGTAINPSHSTEKNKSDVVIIKKHFNSVTAENVLKWERIHPKPEEYVFKHADSFVEFGEKEKMFIVGHTLVWHNQTPDWVFSDEGGNKLSREDLLERLREHIFTVVGRYKGKINGWDVVNEALNEDGSLRESKWSSIIGEDYLIKAFEYANEADPDAELYYNDYSLENEPKRNGAVELIKKLKSAGVKIDGVGLQGHYKMDWPSANQLDSTIKAFADLGVKVMVTELDVDVLPYEGIDYSAEITLSAEMKESLNPYKDGLPESAQKSLADRYSELFIIFINNSDNIDRITFWGVTDKDSWLNDWPIMGRTNYPLLFDRNGKPKLAFIEVVKAVKRE